MESAQQLAIQKLLATVVEYGASDLHLSVGNPPVLRVNGQLVPLNDEEIIRSEFVASLVESMLTPGQKASLEKNKELVITYNFDNKARFRVHIYYQQNFFSLSMRYISTTVKTVEELGLPSGVVKAIQEVQKGLILITGGFGSGRSTTLAAMIHSINSTKAQHIITIEDPVGSLFLDNKSVIDQREVGQDCPSFEAALDAVLNEDVETIMVSEIKNSQTAEKVLDIAESGRLILAAVNATSVVASIDKFVNFFDPQLHEQVRARLGSALSGIMTQKLIPGIDGSLKLAVETLLPDQTSRAIITEGSLYQLRNMIQTSREDGIRSFDRSLIELVQQRKISLERAIQNAADPNNLKQMLNR